MTIADEVWIATAQLHTESSDRADFSVEEVKEKVYAEFGDRRSGVQTHISHHCVANKSRNPARHRLLYEPARGRRRLFRLGDPYDEERANGATMPERERIPAKYLYLIDWYEHEYIQAARGHYRSDKQRAVRIKILLFDVDGVLTDGKIFLMPAPAGAQQHSTARDAAEKADAGGYAIVSNNMVEAKGFHAHDGTAISLARLGGIRTGVITKRISETVKLRARDLRLDFVYQGIADKATCFDQICREAGVSADEVAYVADDIIDLPVMRRCGLAIAVANARESVKDEAHVVVDHNGGDGAARDAVEYILKAQGKLDRVVEEYLGERSPKPDA